MNPDVITLTVTIITTVLSTGIVLYFAITRNMDRRFDGVDKRFEAIDKRFEAIDKRFENIEQQLREHNTRLSRIEGRLDEPLRVSLVKEEVA